MGIRDDLVAIPNAELRRGDLGLALLVFMDFADAPRRWWMGWGDLDAGGHRWQGTGDVITMSGLDAAFGLAATGLTFEVAATPEMIALAKASRERVANRACTVYGQLIRQEAQELVGPPWAITSTIMRKISVQAGGALRRQLTLTCEGVFARRNAPPQGRFTDADQRARWPGDKGLERTPLYESYETRWL